MFPNAGQQPSKSDGITHRHSQFTFLEQFPIEQLQELSRISSSLQEVVLVIKLNAHVLAEIVEYYECLLANNRFPAEIMSTNPNEISELSSSQENIIRQFEREQYPINTLLQKLSNGKAMVGWAQWQERNV